MHTFCVLRLLLRLEIVLRMIETVTFNKYISCKLCLRRWNAMALRVRDYQNRTATELAAENGHTAIAEELNQLETRRQDERLFLRPASPSPRRPSQDSGLDLALC